MSLCWPCPREGGVLAFLFIQVLRLGWVRARAPCCSALGHGDAVSARMNARHLSSSPTATLFVPCLHLICTQSVTDGQAHAPRVGLAERSIGRATRAGHQWRAEAAVRLGSRPPGRWACHRRGGPDAGSRTEARPGRSHSEARESSSKHGRRATDWGPGGPVPVFARWQVGTVARREAGRLSRES